MPAAEVTQSIEVVEQMTLDKAIRILQLELLKPEPYKVAVEPSLPAVDD